MGIHRSIYKIDDFNKLLHLFLQIQEQTTYNWQTVAMSFVVLLLNEVSKCIIYIYATNTNKFPSFRFTIVGF